MDDSESPRVSFVAIPREKRGDFEVLYKRRVSTEVDRASNSTDAHNSLGTWYGEKLTNMSFDWTT